MAADPAVGARRRSTGDEYGLVGRGGTLADALTELLGGGSSTGHRSSRSTPSRGAAPGSRTARWARSRSAGRTRSAPARIGSAP